MTATPATWAGFLCGPTGRTISRLTLTRATRKTLTWVASLKRISFRIYRRHRCQHSSGPTGPPLDLEPVPVPKLSRTNEEYGPIPLDRVERPVLYRLNTELTLNEGTIESTTAYRSEFEEKHAERQTRLDILFFKTNTFLMTAMTSYFPTEKKPISVDANKWAESIRDILRFNKNIFVLLAQIMRDIYFRVNGKFLFYNILFSSRH